MRLAITSLSMLLILAGIAQAIPNPASVYCTQLGYDLQIRTDEHGNQYGVCVFPDGNECEEWAFYRKCYLGDTSVNCSRECEGLPCRRAGESVLIGECCEGLSHIRPAHTYAPDCNDLLIVGWTWLCSDCGNGTCESWESKCNCPEDCKGPKVIYVDDDANGTNDGTSWTSAYKYLQDALADANSSEKHVEIRVAQGTYKPDQGAKQTPGDYEATFQLISNVTLKGAYAGLSEEDPDARDTKLYESILSGDLAGDDIQVDDPYDIHESSRSENSYHVVTGSGVDANTIIDRFIITGGNARSLHYPYGGGLFNRSGEPMVMNCAFIGNSAGGIGGGIFNIRNSPRIVQCVFKANAAFSEGGGMYCVESNLKLVGCTFSANSAKYGGGLNGSGSFQLINCIFSGNSAIYGGGGMCCCGGNFTLDSCTFSGNLSPHGNSLICCDPCLRGPDASNLDLLNCIVWDGQGSIGPHWGSTITIKHSDIYNGWPGEDNIDADPCFVDQGYWDPNGTPNDPNDDFWINGDYHLKSQAGRWEPAKQAWVTDNVTSPCVDAGDPMSPIGLEPFPNGGRINMGAYGGTAEASKSYFGEPPCETIMRWRASS